MSSTATGSRLRQVPHVPLTVLLLVVALLGVISPGPGASTAVEADASPVLDSTPRPPGDAPPPEECVVESRTKEEVLAAFDAADVGEPVTFETGRVVLRRDADGLDVSVDGVVWILDGTVLLPAPASGVGQPVDAAALAEIKAVQRISAACDNAGDLFRGLSLFSDVGLDYVQSQFRAAVSDLPLSEARRIIAEAEVAARPVDSWESVPPIVVARELEPGLIGLLVQRPDGSRLFYAYRLLADGWRVECLDLVTDPAGPPVEPTPPPSVAN